MNKSLRPPWFLRGAHRQTLVGHLLPGTRIGQPDRRYFVPLPDGDTLVLHENLPRKWVPGGPMVLLIHGLTGSHDSGTIRRLAHQLCGANIACQRLDMRGAGDGFALAKNPTTAAAPKTSTPPLATSPKSIPAPGWGSWEFP